MPTNQRPGQARILGIITDCRIPGIIMVHTQANIHTDIRYTVYTGKVPGCGEKIQGAKAPSMAEWVKFNQILLNLIEMSHEFDTIELWLVF